MGQEHGEMGGDQLPFTILEPMTMLTDYVLSAACIFFAVRLFQKVAAGGKSALRLWALGFVSTAIAGLVGGTYHGFAFYIAGDLHRSLWNITLFQIGLGSAFMISGALTSAISRRDEATQWLIGGVVLSLLGLGVQQGGIGLGPNFNHNDLYHCVQIGALYLFYRGARLC